MTKQMGTFRKAKDSFPLNTRCGLFVRGADSGGLLRPPSTPSQCRQRESSQTALYGCTRGDKKLARPDVAFFQLASWRTGTVRDRSGRSWRLGETPEDPWSYTLCPTLEGEGLEKEKKRAVEAEITPVRWRRQE